MCSSLDAATGGGVVRAYRVLNSNFSSMLDAEASRQKAGITTLWQDLLVRITLVFAILLAGNSTRQCVSSTLSGSWDALPFSMNTSCLARERFFIIVATSAASPGLMVIDLEHLTAPMFPLELDTPVTSLSRHWCWCPRARDVIFSLTVRAHKGKSRDLMFCPCIASWEHKVHSDEALVWHHLAGCSYHWEVQ